MTRFATAIVCVTLLMWSVAAERGNAQPAPATPAPTVIVAEGEFFTPQPAKDGGAWKLTPQDHSYASHTYGGMWSNNGALIGAPAASVGAVATQKITVPAAGAYRVWSKYQAPPYFNYMHQIEVIQGGKTVFSNVYGKVEAPRFWSFGTPMNKQIWWFWGIDHDAAEAPKTTANLAAGEAEIRITTVAQPQPAGDRFIDFVVLTTEPKDTYEKIEGHGIGSPFMMEAWAANRLYARFKNTTAAPAVLSATCGTGHIQPQYYALSGEFPAKGQPVAPGAWSPWFNIAPVLRLAADEGLMATLPGNATFDFQLARDSEGKDLVADLKLPSGEVLVIPKEIAWDKSAKVLTSREHAAQIIALAKTKWRTANGGKKPQKIAFYGVFGKRPGQDWVDVLKDAVGYNTQLPDTFNHIQRDGYYAHTSDEASIRKYAASLTPQQRANMHILSFGDEIHIPDIDYALPANNEKFKAWVKTKGLTAADLGVDPAQATLSKAAPRIAWYSNLFNEVEGFATFAANTRLAEELFNPDILTGANYSPHPSPQYYGPISQWVDIFKYRGMKCYWAEDYVFSVPESPQIISWMFATVRCAVKYHDLPAHFYIMPHAPGQTHENLHRSLLYAVGAGAIDIDNFWIAPAEWFTENFVSWGYLDTFRVLHEAIYDSAEVEDISVGGKPRPARVAVVLSKATEFNEKNLVIDPAKDPFASQCTNFPQGLWQQTLCRKDQQMLYLALRDAQHGVELITEEDINEGVKGKDILPNYDVIYFAGEWIDDHAAKKLDAWVKNGGVLYAAAGVGHLNQFNEPAPVMMGLLGVKSVSVAKNAYHLRPLLELPLAPPIDTITLDDGEKIAAIGMKQVLAVDGASGAKVIGKWSDGSAAVTVRDYGKGKAFAVGTLAGHSFFKTGTKPLPWARGGYKNLYAPIDFDPAATKLALLGVDARPGLARDVVCSNKHVEALVLDNKGGTLVTLVNWANDPAKAVKVTLKLPFKPASVRLVSAEKDLPVAYENGTAVFTLDVAEAEYVLLKK
jgi:hypothetical protein